jgi:hypothetical protein
MLKDILLCAGGLIAIFIVPAITIALIWQRGKRRDTRSSESWNELATNLGLAVEPRYVLGASAGPVLQGNYRGRGVSLFPLGRESPLLGEEKLGYRLWVGLRAKQLGKLSFRWKTAVDRAASIVRGDGVKIGDVQFDEKFVIRADSHEAARKTFSSASLKQQLLEGPPLSFIILEDRIQSILTHSARDTDYWRSVVDLLCEIAEAVEGAET